MKKFFIITLIIIFTSLYGINRYLSLDGTGGESALISPGSDTKPLALVTGATGKIATELVKLLDKKGYRLILHGRSEEKLTALASTLNNAETMTADFTNPDDRAKVITLIHNRKPDLVINNAAYIQRGLLVDFTAEQSSKAIVINCVALTELTIAAVHAMRKANKRGIVLNISSISGLLGPTPRYAVYGATKSYVTNFSIAFDYELRGTGIRVLTSHPGRVATVKGRDPSQRDIVSLPEATEAIYQQIQNRTTQHTFHGYYRLLNAIQEWIPQNIKLRILERSAFQDHKKISN